MCKGLVCRTTSATVPRLCVSMPSCSAVINTQHKGSSRHWGLGKRCLNHFAFSLAELLLMRGRRSWEPFVQSLACVSNCSGGRPHVIPTSPPLRHPGTQQGYNLGCPAQKTQGGLSLGNHRGKIRFFPWKIPPRGVNPSVLAVFSHGMRHGGRGPVAAVTS